MHLIGPFLGDGLKRGTFTPPKALKGLTDSVFAFLWSLSVCSSVWLHVTVFDRAT